MTWDRQRAERTLERLDEMTFIRMLLPPVVGGLYHRLRDAIAEIDRLVGVNKKIQVALLMSRENNRSLHAMLDSSRTLNAIDARTIQEHHQAAGCLPELLGFTDAELMGFTSKAQVLEACRCRIDEWRAEREARKAKETAG